MKIRSLAIGALALVLSLGAVACGGKDDTDSGDRPSADEIATALKDQVPGADETDGEADESLQCMGQELHDSDLPAGVLRALVDGREAEVDKDNEEEYREILDTAMNTCIERAMEDLDLPDDLELPDDVELPDDLEDPGND